MSDHLSRAGAAAFLGGVAAAIQAIDKVPLQSRSSNYFLEVLYAALEHISLHYDNLTLKDQEDLYYLVHTLTETVRTQKFPGFENFL